MATRNPFMAGAPSDPLPWLTERFREYGVFDEDVTEVQYLSRVLGACQSTVNAMSDHNKTFVVKFAGEAKTAFTDGKTQRIVVGTRNLIDSSLSEGQRAAITVALAAHEVGHVRWSVTMMTRLGKHYDADPFRKAWALKVFNVLHDIHLEHCQQADFPSLAPVFDLKGRYFARPWTFKATRNVERYGALINATLYAHATDWTVSPEAQAFYEWATDWAKRGTDKKARTLKGAVALIDEALDRLGYDEQPDIPEDETPTPTEPEDDDGDDEADDSEATDSEPTDSDSDEDEDDEGEGTGSPEPTEGEGEEQGDWDDMDDGSDMDGDDEGSGSDGPPESRDDSAPGMDENDSTEGDPEEEVTRRIGDEGDSTRGDEEPLPTIHGDMHTEDDVRLQGEIDRYERVQAHSRDRFIVGGGELRYREMRIVRVKR